MAFVNVCRFTPTAGGTTDWTYSAAVTGYQSPSAAGIVNGSAYKYRAESADLSQWEVGEGTYNTSTGVLTRTTVLYNSSGTGASAGQSGAGNKINFSTVPQVAIIALGEDIVNMSPPSGRITLASGIPVMAASQAGCTTVYYTPYAGNVVPIYDGTNFAMMPFAELSQATTDATKSPAAVAASKVYDLFVWNDAGTLRCTRGPAWSSSTSRGYTLSMVNGILLNTSSITNGPAALRGTWVGTIASNSSSLIDFIFGTSGAGGVAGAFNVWNAYNRVDVGCTVINTSATYTYTTNTVRQAAASAGMQVSFVVGAAEDAVAASYQDVTAILAATAAFTVIGLGYDSTSVLSSKGFLQNPAAVSSVVGSSSVPGVWNPGIGTHFVAALEQSDGSHANNFNFAGGVNPDGLTFKLRM